MDEKKQDFEQTQEDFSLEDIIREFGSDSAAEPADEEKADAFPAQSEEPVALPEETADDDVTVAAADADDDVTVAVPAPQPEDAADAPEEAADALTSDTIRMPVIDDDVKIADEPARDDAPTDAAEEAAADLSDDDVKIADEPAPAEAKPVTSDTVRIEIIPDVQGTVHDALHIDDTNEPAPYSEEWEPKYEQPIADYAPPPPIPFKPKQRLREIKKKLVEGPEQEYYRLAEKGFGRLQTAIFFSFLVVLLSAAATLTLVLDGPLSHRSKFMVFVQFMTLLFSALLGSFQLVDGFLAIFKGKFNLNTLLFFGFAACVADGILCFRQVRIPCCAAFSLQVTMALWSTYQSRSARMGQLDTMRKATRLDGLFPVEHEGTVYLVRGQGEVEHFTKADKDTPGQEKLLNIYALAALLLSVCAGVLSLILHGTAQALQVASVTALAAMPASMLICVRRPMGVLEHRLHKHNTVLCGWKGAKTLCGKRQFLIDHEDLFPEGTVKLNGVKFFGNREPDQVIAYATALITKERGTLNDAFTQLLDSRNGFHYDPKEFQFYDGGVGGLVNGEPVLVGSSDLLRSMGVEIPEGIQVSQAVFVSIDGELSGLFAMNYDVTRSAARGLVTLCGYRKLQPVLISRDFMLTPSFIREHFGVRPKRIRFPEMEERAQLSRLTPAPETDAAVLVTTEGLRSLAYGVAGARSLKTGVGLGIIVHLIGGILGIAMMLALSYLNATWLLTPANLFLYELVWLVPGILITEWTRSI